MKRNDFYSSFLIVSHFSFIVHLPVRTNFTNRIRGAKLYWKLIIKRPRFVVFRRNMTQTISFRCLNNKYQILFTVENAYRNYCTVIYGFLKHLRTKFNLFHERGLFFCCFFVLLYQPRHTAELYFFFFNGIVGLLVQISIIDSLCSEGGSHLSSWSICLFIFGVFFCTK